MKKLILLFCLVAFGMNAQTTTQTINSKLKLNNVPLGSVTDSILVRGADRIVKKISKNDLLSNSSSNLQQVTELGSTTSVPVTLEGGATIATPLILSGPSTLKINAESGEELKVKNNSNKVLFGAGNNSIFFQNNQNVSATVSNSNLSSNRNYELPDISGTLSIKENTTLQNVTNTGNVTTNAIHADGGITSTWANGSAEFATPFSASNRGLNFISNGDGNTVPSSNGVQFNVQPDLPIQLMRTTANGNNYLEIDDNAYLATNGSFSIATAGGLTNVYYDELGFGFSTDNPNKVYFRNDNLTSNKFLQVPDISGTIAVKGDINLQDILSVNGESYTGTFPDALSVNLTPQRAFIQQQFTHPLDNNSYVGNVVDLYNDIDGSSVFKYSKGDISTTAISNESIIKLNDNGIGLKTSINSNYAWLKTNQLSGIGDKVYNLPDVSGGTLLTTKGTTTGFPLDGNLQFTDGERDFEIFNTNTTELNYRGSLYFGGSALNLTTSNDEGNSIVSLTPDFFSVSFSDAASPGIVGQEDYSNNLLEYSFVQKPYVDKNRLKEYTVATLPAGTLGDTAFVTDATSPTYLGTLTGGGSVKCPVFFNGSVWVSH